MFRTLASGIGGNGEWWCLEWRNSSIDLTSQHEGTTVIMELSVTFPDEDKIRERRDMIN